MADENTEPVQGTLSAEDAGAGAPGGPEGPGAVLAGLGARFEHVRVLGRGGMGVVHLARDGELDRLVAIKRVAVSGHVAGSRLQREARLAAKIEHRNVVAVYDVSVAEDALYIISEYIEGKGLHQVETPVPWAKALAWGLDLARGLAAAHERGVLHRDIKPANAILDERTQQVRLIDFGVAKLVADAPRARADDPLSATTAPDRGRAPGRVPEGAPDDEVTETGSTRTPPGARPGTPRYQAPELWDGQPASTRTDVYALGALLYELCTGQKPRVMDEPDTRCAMRLAEEEVDPRFAHIVNRCLELDPARRHASGTELAEALAELQAAPIAPENPYRGLLCFHERHRGLFFGRELDTARIVERVQVEPFLLLVGESGVGKSSLAHAGVLPRLRRELDPDRPWTIHAMVPGRRPLSALRRALSQRGEAGLVLFIDQLEELLTVSEPEEARGAQALLAGLARRAEPGGADAPEGSVRVLAAVRWDHLPRLLETPELGGLLERHIHFVRALDAAGVRAAIVEPARRTGVTFESDELVEELQQATTRARGGTPLLQFALAELWAARDRARGVITRQSLDEIGGVAGALARHADSVLAELPGRAQHDAAQRILIRLVAVHHRTRKRCTRHDLVGEDAVGQAVLERLVDSRLVVCHQAEGEWVYSIAHEALLAAWPTLRGWLDRESELQNLRGHLADAAQRWQALGRSSEALWGQRLMREAARIDTSELSANEAAFLAASRRKLLRARWLVRGIVLAVIVLGVGIYGVSRYQARRELRSQVDGHLAQAKQELDRASMLHEAYFDAHAQVEARLQAGKGGWTASWNTAMSLDPEVLEAYRKAGYAPEATYMVDPARDDGRALLARTLEKRAWFAETTGRYEDRDDLLGRLNVIDAKRAEPWRAETPVTVTTTPGGGALEIQRYARRPDARFETKVIETAATPLETALEPGSYLVIVQASEDRAEVRYPLEIRPSLQNTPVKLSIHRPRVADVPEGFVYVSEGWFWSGYGQTPEQNEYREYYESLPLHRRHIGAYLIAAHETTYEDWLAYVDDCTRRACPGGAPAREIVAKGDEVVQLTVRREPEKAWQIHWKPDPAQDGYRAFAGEDLVYEARKTEPGQDPSDILVSQNWLELPVSGVSWLQVQGYLAWLREVQGVRGADLCTEAQWERAARGADARLYPHGNGLSAADANIDKTYGQKPGAFGPDVVDAHAPSASPFGVLNMAGNVMEMTRPEAAQGETLPGEAPQIVAARGGAFFYPAIDARVFGRWYITPQQNPAVVGFRVCAAAPAE